MSPALQRRSWIGMCFGLFFVILILAGGNMWWGWEAQASDRMVYRVPRLQAVLRENSLNVRLENPNSDSFTGSAWRNFWAQTVDSNDLVPDHGHIMHLFLVRMPDMKSFWHLHPEPTGSTSEFSAKLPALPPGRYRVYADIVHGTGFPETQVGQIDINDVAGQALGGDDSGGPDLAASDKTVKLPDGDRMVWERAAAPLRSREAVVFRFRVEDKDGKPATDLENYMGMAGHAVFMSDDGTVFAHVHPEGSVSMAALALAQGSRGPAGPAGSTGSTNAGSMNMDAMNMDAMNMGAMNMGAMKTPSPPAEVSFPYGFPQAGNYHVFVQIKRAGHVDTGVFTAHVEM